MNLRPESRLLENATTRAVIGAFYDVHRALGYGYREYIYALAMERELKAKGRRVDREVQVMVHYRGEELASQILDMIVNEKVVVEIKATETIHPNATSQLFSYLCATELEVGILLHFGRDPRFYRVIYENRLKRRFTAPTPDPLLR